MLLAHLESHLRSRMEKRKPGPLLVARLLRGVLGAALAEGVDAPIRTPARQQVTSASFQSIMGYQKMDRLVDYVPHMLRMHTCFALLYIHAPVHQRYSQENSSLSPPHPRCHTHRACQEPAAPLPAAAGTAPRPRSHKCAAQPHGPESRLAHLSA